MGKQKGKNSQGSSNVILPRIGRALLPSPVFAAVPAIPHPPSLPISTSAVAEGMWRATLLAQGIALNIASVQCSKNAEDSTEPGYETVKSPIQEEPLLEERVEETYTKPQKKTPKAEVAPENESEPSSFSEAFEPQESVPRGDAVWDSLKYQNRCLERQLSKMKKEYMELLRKFYVSQTSLDSGFQQNLIETTNRRQDEVVKTLHSQLSMVMNENRDLAQQTAKLKEELLQKKLATPVREHTKLQKEESELLQTDVQMLKDMVYRLNVELSKYQKKFRPLSTPELESTAGHLPQSGLIPQWLTDSRKVTPLFIAYDETIKERDELVNEYEKELQDFKSRCKEVMAENEHLHIQLEEARNKGPVSFEEWKILHENAALVLEENDLLLEQLHVQQEKYRHTDNSLQQMVSEMKQKVYDSQQENQKLQLEVKSLQAQYTTIWQQCEQLRKECEDKIPIGQHNDAVHECKRLFESVKDKYYEDRKNLEASIEGLKNEKRRLSGQVAELTAEKIQSEAHLKTALKSQSKSQYKAKYLEEKLLAVTQSLTSAQDHLNEVLELAEQVLKERDVLAELIRDQKKGNQRLSTQLNVDTHAIGRLQQKLKTLKQEAAHQVQMIEGRLKEQDDNFIQQKSEYERELRHLRMLLKDKQVTINSLTSEKHKANEDLETLMKVAAAENRQLKEQVKASLMLPEGGRSTSVLRD